MELDKERDKTQNSVEELEELKTTFLTIQDQNKKNELEIESLENKLSY